MGWELGTDWRQDVASALDWWRDAGVDTLVEDEIRDWLARPVPKADGARAAATAAAAPPPEKLPDTLEAYVAWRTGEGAMERDWMSPIVAPSGTPGGLMILTDMPEAEDVENGALMSGSAGRLLDAMLAAIGESRDSAYFASLAVARPLTGQIASDDAPRLLALARHHVSLVAPKRLLILGQAAKGVSHTTNSSESENTQCEINQSGGTMDIVSINHPRFLLQKPVHKAEAWRQLTRFIRGTSL